MVAIVLLAIRGTFRIFIKDASDLGTLVDIVLLVPNEMLSEEAHAASIGVVLQ